MLPIRAAALLQQVPRFPRSEVCAPLAWQRRRMMLDVMYLAIGFGFLAVTVFYAMACDRL
jgi:hypothetical protein